MRTTAVLLVAVSLFGAEPKPAAPVTALAFSPDGKLLVSGGYRQLLVREMRSGKLSRKIGPFSGAIRGIAFHPDGRTLAVAEGVPGRSGAVTLVNFDSGETNAIERTKDEMLAVAFSPDGKILASGGTDGAVTIWPAAGGDALKKLEHAGWVTALAFSPDGKLLASGSSDQTVQVWDTTTWTSRMQLPQPATGEISGVAFSPENDLLAFAVNGADERAIRVWRSQNAFVEVDSSRPGRANALRQTRAFDLGTCMPLAVTFVSAKPHSRMLASCADKTIRVIGPGGNQFPALAGHADWVYTVAASPDGTRIASGSGDGTVKIWGPGGRLHGTLTEEPAR